MKPKKKSKKPSQVARLKRDLHLEQASSRYWRAQHNALAAQIQTIKREHEKAAAAMCARMFDRDRLIDRLFALLGEKRDPVNGLGMVIGADMQRVP
jgi:hypothetical protein